ncbi:MAG: prepilin-type N-terminal cleavage/methylation domain-containing protein [Verrucomicrobiota bacterium]
MKIKFQKKFRAQSGLTLVEMMVATTLLVVIMLGLTAMFNQVQRAFRGGLKQVDVFEGGRAIMDLVARDVEQLTASKDTNNWSLYAGMQADTYLTSLNPTGTAPFRTNVLDELFLLNYASDWSAIGYRVLNPQDLNNFNNLKFGTLYRFSTNNFVGFRFPTNYYFNNLFNSGNAGLLLTNGYLSRVADGVVHFKVTFYDAAGFVTTNGTKGVSFLNPQPSVDLTNEFQIAYSGDALPSLVEIELGVLEPQTLEQARSMADPTSYLQKQGGKIHIFKQQIPIRNAPR